MGLLDKLKHGLQGSGVHTEIDGPGSVSSDQPGIDLVISFTANEGPAVLEGYVVTLAREVEEEQVGGPSNMNSMGNTETHQEGPTQVVAQDPAPIELQPKVPVAINVQVPLDVFATAMRAHAGLLGMAFGDFAQANQEVEYVVHVRAQVRGSSHHAHASHTVRGRSFGFRS
ncbi:MAG: hypothetical protein ACLQVK_15260 [Acidimicrobiales bacterium]